MMLTIPIPPSVNGIWRAVSRGGRTHCIKSAPYKRWLNVVVPLMRMGLPHVPPPARVLILIYGGKGWRRGRDLDNVAKVVLDGLRHAQRIEDDSTEHVVEVRMRYHPAKRVGEAARCEVAFFREEI
jgi:crossover junction endodeoxyribonuclease RusA